MIRFSDVDGAPKEISAPEKMNIIESANQMSDFEVDSFWKAEFANARDSMEMDPYERLLSESFNRSEDEINIDFGIDEKLLADLESFRAENWDAMDEIQRMAAIKEVLQKAVDRMGMNKTPEIALYDGALDDYGAYNPDTNEISLNRNLFNDPIETLNTAMHELRHAFQRFRADKLETWEDKLHAFNLGNYIQPLPLPDGNYLYYTDYYGQFVEVDARVFANKFTEALKG